MHYASILKEGHTFLYFQSGLVEQNEGQCVSMSMLDLNEGLSEKNWTKLLSSNNM